MAGCFLDLAASALVAAAARRHCSLGAWDWLQRPCSTSAGRTHPHGSKKSSYQMGCLTRITMGSSAEVPAIVIKVGHVTGEEFGGARLKDMHLERALLEHFSASPRPRFAGAVSRMMRVGDLGKALLVRQRDRSRARRPPVSLGDSSLRRGPRRFDRCRRCRNSKRSARRAPTPALGATPAEIASSVARGVDGGTREATPTH